MSPWKFVYEKMSLWLLDHLDYELVDYVGVCDCCGDHSSEWPTPDKGVSYTDSYKRSMTICEGCYTLYESTIEAMGKERAPNVPNKFGMWLSVSVVVDQKGVTLIIPKGIKAKLPATFPLPFITYGEGEMTKKEVKQWMFQQEWSYPAVFIDDLGKKKKELVGSLEYTYSSRKVVLCSADERVFVNMDAVKECMHIANTIETRAQLNKIKKILNSMGAGKISPKELSRQVRDDEKMIALMKASTPDPVLRKYIAGLI